MPLPPVKSNVPNLVHVQPPVGNPPAAPELPGEDPQAQAPRMPTGELVATQIFPASFTAVAPMG